MSLFIIYIIYYYQYSFLFNTRQATIFCGQDVGLLVIVKQLPWLQRACLYVCSNVLCVGTMMGISNTLATLPGFIGPAVVGALTYRNVWIASALIKEMGKNLYCWGRFGSTKCNGSGSVHGLSKHRNFGSIRLRFLYFFVLSLLQFCAGSEVWRF